MVKIDLIKSNGEKSGTAEISDKIFKAKVNSSLIDQIIKIQLANKRSGNAHAKTRSEVRGGGKKPWKQKGTGNARAGSTRSPLWIGGGVTFGPRNTRNWKLAMPKKMLRNAIYSALSNKLSDKKIIVVDKLEFHEIKTSSAESFLQKMPIKEGTILLIIAKSNMNLELSFRNLPYVKVIMANSLNIYDILKYDYIITSQDAVVEIENIFLKMKSEAKTNKHQSKKNEVKNDKLVVQNEPHKVSNDSASIKKEKTKASNKDQK